MNKNKTRKIFLEELPRRGKLIDWKNSIGYKIKFIYEDIKDEFEIIEYDKKYQKLKIKYNDNEYYILIGNLKKCKLGNILNKHTYNFKIEIGQTFKDNKRDLIIIDRKYKRKERKDGKIKNEKLYKYHCNKCGFDCGKHYSLKDKQYKDELWIREDHLLHGVGCSCCGKGNQITIKGINDIATTHPWMIKYFVNVEDCYKYRYSSEEIVLCKCLQCGYEKEMDIFNLYKNGFSCSQCCDGISYPEKFMFNLLKQLRIDFVCQFGKTKSKWCNKYKYDFYFKLNNEEYIIETHGLQHYEENTNFKMPLKEVKENDKDKKELAVENGIKPENYIVIDCRYSELEFIKNNILHSRLNEIFDLNNIDWIKIGQDSEKSLVKEVCDYWHLHNEINNEGLLIKDLSYIFKINPTTISRYLKTGTKIDLCNFYSGSSRKVEIFKDGISLGIFKSCSELSRQSEKLFNIKLDYRSILFVATGKGQNYKGFTFRYV